MMIELKTCPICNFSLEKSPVSVLRAASQPIGETVYGLITNTIVHYSQCWKCGTFIQTPRPSDADLTMYYASGDYRKWIVMTPEQADADEKNRAVADALYIQNLGVNFKSHLDVGCSRGYLLKEVGCEVRMGIEINPQYVTEDVGIATNIELVSRHFDLVTVIHTLEHVTDPLATLIECRKRLERDGTLIVEVPTDQSPGGWARVAHTFHFPTWSMYYLAEKAGLYVENMIKNPHLLVTMKRM